MSAPRRRRAGGLVALTLVLLAAWTLRGEPAPGPVGGWMAAAGITPADVTVGGTRVRYVRKGSGPPVVLLHGFAASIYTWKDVLPALAAVHDVVAIDLPGFGASDIPHPLDGAIYPDVVRAVMDELGVQRAAVVGHSLGGSIAVGLAAAHPERVSHLVLIDSAGFNFAPADRPWMLRMIAAPGMAAMAERLPVRRRLVSAGLRQVYFDDALATEERIDEYAVPMLRPGAARAAAELLSAAGQPDFASAVTRVRAPTLVVWGREDAWIPVAHAERFTAAIPGATAVVLESCGHVPQEEKPAETAGLIARFVGAPPRVD